MNKSFKDELNQVDKEFNRKQRLLDIATFFVITTLIALIIFLATIDLWN